MKKNDHDRLEELTKAAYEHATKPLINEFLSALDDLNCLAGFGSSTEAHWVADDRLYKINISVENISEDELNELKEKSNHMN